MCTENNNNSDNKHILTDAGGNTGAPHLVVLAGCRLLALQAEPRGAEELAARVEVGAVRALVAAVDGHVQLGTADLCQRRGQCLHAATHWSHY